MAELPEFDLLPFSQGNYNKCEISGCHRDEHEDGCLLGCHTV